MEKTKTLIARMGTRSLQVEVDRGSKIIPPEGTTLEDGTYTLSLTETEGGREIGFFKVKNGKPGLGYTTPARSVRLVINLGYILDALFGDTWAEMLEDALSSTEMLAAMIDGKACPCCGQIHTVNETRWSPQEVEEKIQAFVQYLNKSGILALLQNLLTNEEGRYELGYDNDKRVQKHLVRVQAILDWQPPAAATTPQPPATEPPAADPEPAG